MCELRVLKTERSVSTVSDDCTSNLQILDAGTTHENRGSPCSLKYFSSASNIPSNQGNNFFAQ